jgi:hypothetical protein
MITPMKKMPDSSKPVAEQAGFLGVEEAASAG